MSYRCKIAALFVTMFVGAMGLTGCGGAISGPAPQFDLPIVNSPERASLQRHAGKDIVVLDFWATWCYPCVQAMPVIASVAEQYRGRGVVVYAVNQAESADEVSAFIGKHGLGKMTVAMDANQTVAQAYGVRGIPTTVVIDKQGIIRNVHVGYSTNLGAELRGELDSLLAEP